MKILKLSFVIMTLLSLVGCDSRQTYSELTRVDSLLNNNQLDSAQQILGVVRKAHFNKECSMYYKLLNVRADYILYKPINSTETIDNCISYFEQHNDLKKTAESYYYKAGILYDLGELRTATINLKKSEVLSTNINDSYLKYRIYSFLQKINTDINDNEKAILYARKVLSLAKNTKDNINKIYAYNGMAVTFGHLSYNDSARWYCNKIIPLLNYLQKEEKVSVLDNLGYFNMEKSPDLALKFLNMAMKIGPSPDTYDNLARIYAKKGLVSKADSLWQHALQCDNLHTKVTILEAIYQQKQQGQNYKDISKYATWLINLKDSLAEQRQNEQIKELQMQFDHDTEVAQQKEDKRKYMYLTCGCSLLAIIALFAVRINTLKNKKKMAEKANELLLKEHELLEKQNIIANYQNRIEILKRQGKTDMATIEKLQQKVDKLKDAQDAYTHKGELLYQAAKKGLSIREWNKAEQMSFLSCYASKDIEYSLTLEVSGNYTPRQKIFRILQHEGWSDNKIAEMMGLSSGALRTMKSRIKKLNDEKDNLE